MQASVSCYEGRKTACDPHTLGCDQSGEQRGPDFKHSEMKEPLSGHCGPSKGNLTSRGLAARVSQAKSFGRDRASVPRGPTGCADVPMDVELDEDLARATTEEVFTEGQMADVPEKAVRHMVYMQGRPAKVPKTVLRKTLPAPPIGRHQCCHDQWRPLEHPPSVVGAQRANAFNPRTGTPNAERLMR